MADEPRIVISSEATISSEEIARRTFATAFRGFDAPEVRSFLKRVAEAYAGLQEDIANLRRRIDELQRREKEPVELDEDALTAALGAETARVLKSAREAAVDIQAKAEQKVARLVKEAEEEAGRLRAEADTVLGRRVDEAEEVAAGIRRAAEADAEAARSKARAAAQAEIEAAKVQGRVLLTEAQALREKVLGDLSRRRKVALAQVEQLRAGRERLLDAYRVVRRTLDEVTAELSAAEAEARLAAESAGRKVAAEPDVTIDDLEAELAAGRAVDLPSGGDGDDDGGAGEGGGEGEGPVEDSSAVAEPAEATEPAQRADAAQAPADPDAPIGAAPESGAPVVQLEERRSSTLRILRRSKNGGNGTAASEEAAVELPVVEPTGDDEGVRVIPAEPGAEEAGEGVDALFARIRADRAAAVAEARAVLEDEPPEAVAASEDDAGEPVAESEDEIEAAVPDVDEARLQQRDELLQKVDAALVRKLKRALQDDQNETLDRVRTTRGAIVAADVLPDEGAHASRFRDVAAPVLGDAAKAGASFAANPSSVAGISDQADDLALDLVVALRERLTRNLEDGAAAGDDVNGVIERVGTTYREWKLQRVEPAARHAVATVFARNAFAATPDGTMLRWIVDDDGGPCPDCDDDALAGPTRKGDAFPTGQLHPPAHPGCRCVLAAEGEAGSS
jgi:DivIVA domain-containing protein